MAEDYRSATALGKWVQGARFACGIGSASVLPEWLATFSGRIVAVTGCGLDSRQTPASSCLKNFMETGKNRVHLTVDGEPSDLWVDEAKRAIGDADAVLSIGGGSALDAGKALAVLLEEEGATKDFLEGIGTKKPSGKMKPWFALPTTAGTGSEATANAVLGRFGEGGFKKSLRHANFRAAGVILDGKLTEGAPKFVCAASGLDALTQLMEAWLSLEVEPEIEKWLEHGLLLALRHLPEAVNNPSDSSRQAMLETAYLSGAGLSRCGLGTVHGLAGPMGAVAAVPHGLACARIQGPCLIESVRWMRENPGSPGCSQGLKKLENLAHQLSEHFEIEGNGLDDFLKQIAAWADAFGLPKLGESGIGEKEIERVVATGSDRNNPARLGKEVWKKVLREATW